jgi:hypothetical protein
MVERMCQSLQKPLLCLYEICWRRGEDEIWAGGFAIYGRVGCVHCGVQLTVNLDLFVTGDLFRVTGV